MYKSAMWIVKLATIDKVLGVSVHKSTNFSKFKLQGKFLNVNVI